MNNNIQNGGLVCKLYDAIILANMNSGIGMHWDQERYLAGVMPWFLNVDGETLYYSDGAKGNYICQMTDEREITLVEVPAYLVQQYKQYLYYINEEDSQLYRYSLYERQIQSVVKDTIETFILAEEHIWYTNEKGIFQQPLEGGMPQRICKNSALRLGYSNGKVFFIDKASYTINYIVIQTGEVITISEAVASSMNIYGDCIFYNNMNDKSHLYRYSLESEFNIKFIPERANYIHIIDETMYYFNEDQKIWMQVSVQGGKPIQVMATNTSN